MNGNATDYGRYADFVAKVNQALWSAVKPAVEKGEFDFSRYSTIALVRDALRSGFLNPKAASAKPDLGLNIGKVGKDELADLTGWDIKKLYSLFYIEVYGSYLHFPDELIPEASDEFSWLSCVSGFISNEVSFSGGKNVPPHWKWTDRSLDVVLDLTQDRDAWTHSYIVRVRPNWEADEDLKNISANEIESRGINVLMLRERLILGRFLFWLTGEHLDRKTITLTGSRYAVGFVPCVYWSGGKLGVYGYPPDNADGDLRSRQAVS
jgi:hypothetical protein